MKAKNDKEKNNFFFQEMNANEKTIKYNIFKFFYSLFLKKKGIKTFLKIIQIFIETIQFISYGFSSNHYDSWKIKTKNVKMISNTLSAFRLSFFMKFLKYRQYMAISYAFIIIIFILCLIVVLNILFIETSSKLYRYSSKFIKDLIDILSILLYIPLTEIMLLPIKCVNGKVSGFKDGEKCWQNLHYLDFSFGIIGAFLLFIWSIFMLNFSFYPFQNSLSTIRITSNNDIIIICLKLFLVLQNLLISNEYISITILLLVAIIMFFYSYNNPAYNNNKIEISIIIKNSLILWTFFVLLISKLFVKVLANGFSYLLVFGSPIVIYLSIIVYQERNFGIIKTSGNINNLNVYIKKLKMNLKLINSFLERNQNIRNGNDKEGQKNIILLKGNIKIHNLICCNKDCPLTKFVNNEGNFNTQKQCLLNYMNIYFNKGLKMYPNNTSILLLNIYFNYSKRFNLNNVRNNLLQLKKIKCNLKEEYIIYCMEQNIKNMKNNGIDLIKDNEQNNDSQADFVEQKYLKLKYCIESSIKLYGEFWGIFSTNISSNINTTKLYSLGEKINIYLNEMNNIWENELKNKRISNEYQGIVQLYSKFLLEVLWDQKKSREVYKKINEENLNNFHLNDIKKENKENNNNSNNIDSLIDNQDFLIFADSDEKGNCKIIQPSASFSHYLGYQKIEIIGKPIEMIFPDILIEDNTKYLEETIKLLHNRQANQNDLSFNESDTNKNSKLTVIKNRMGYVFPFFASFSFLEDNDYSDSFLVKIKFENKFPKTEYSYFILTNPEFGIENISSSAINLGLSLDLLKKYVVKIDILIRIDNNKAINLEKYDEYEEDPKEVVWVFPDVIYPKDGVKKNKEEEIEELIKKSKKKKYNLQIKSINDLNGNENIAYLFKLTEIISKKNKKKINGDIFIPKSDTKLILFYLNKLNYVRTYVVGKKSGLNNLKTEEQIQDKDNNLILQNNKLELKKNKKNKRNIQTSEDESSENSENMTKNILTKEKILELQVYNFIEIRNFIYSLPLYGLDVSLERFRPNGDKYSASKITESLIKININYFCKRIDERLKISQNEKKKRIKNLNENQHVESSKSSNINNNLFSSDTPSLPISSSSSSSIQGEELNKGLSSDSSSALSNIFKANTIKYIKILIGFIFAVTLFLILIEFIITFTHINKLKKKITFLKSSYTILSNMLFTKHFVTEGVISNILENDYTPVQRARGISNYLKTLVKELANNRQELTEIYDIFASNELCKEFKKFMSDTSIKIFTISLGAQENLTLLYNNAMSRISSSINNLASNPSLMKIDNRDTYELIYNLLNEYFINWKKVINILLNDSLKTTELKIPIMLIVISYFLISIVVLFIFIELLSKFSLDREKPINLFLTLKKVVFENLKNSAENFSNKLLNKFFGNEENEEESQQDYQTNIQPNDINIIKFKAANENTASINKAFDFYIIILIITLFLLINLIYFIIKFFYFRQRMTNIQQFVLLFHKTNFAHFSCIQSTDIFISYLYNSSIPISNYKETRKVFLGNLIHLSDYLEDSIIYNSKSDSFFSGNYLKKYKQYYLGDYSELLDKDFLRTYGPSLSSYLIYGIKPIEFKIYEIIRYLTIVYCKIGIAHENENNYNLFVKLGRKISEMNLLTETIHKYWFNGVIDLMIDSLYDYQEKGKLKYIIFSCILLLILILYYLIIWRIYEEKLNNLLKGSADLINLIPQEIKNIIIEKLNE